MRAIIMADGKSTRWFETAKGTEFENVNKHFLLFDGEFLLHRTVRLLKENGVEDIWVTSHDPQYDIDGTIRYAPDDNEYEIDKFYAPKHVWDLEETLFIYGDVYFTEEAMKKIVETEAYTYLFFGIFHHSYYTNHGGEIFAVKVIDHDYFAKTCKLVRKKHIEEGTRCGAWELYRAMHGMTDKRIGAHIPYGHFIGIDDWTDDFDTIEHYFEWLVLYNEEKEKRTNKETSRN